MFDNEFLTQSIIDDIVLHFIKLFYDHYHLKKNYKKGIDPSFNLFAAWINKILNATNKNNVNF